MVTIDCLRCGLRFEESGYALPYHEPYLGKCPRCTYNASPALADPENETVENG